MLKSPFTFLQSIGKTVFKTETFRQIKNRSGKSRSGLNYHIYSSK
ncbi:hypothetical protein CHCC15139_4314 [Bacillus licheniformis]|nr:hypothetical protein CHCC20339_2206 [Bacillus licheniformis]TWM10785.1 hypothetical protein CHCC15139_4314 [Bacillus licheniformis]